MDGIVSLLPPPYYARVESIWDDLEQALGLSGYQFTPYPHFSWQIASTYAQDGLRTALQDLAAQTSSITIRTTGIGLFTGDHPVVYIPIVKTMEMVTLHQRIWDALQSTGSGISPYYAPGAWMPHISLAFLDVTPANIGPLMERLSFNSFTWSMTIDHFAYLYQPEGIPATIPFTVPFGKKH